MKPKDMQINVRISSDMKGWIEKKAQAEERSQNYIVVKILEAAMEKEKEAA